ncbi:MAG: hypothetical protein ABII10_00605, partial [Candidatus Paceibacterota bacterium]
VNLKQTFGYIFPELAEQSALFFIVLIGVILTIGLKISRRKIRESFFSLFLIWLSPALFLTIVIQEAPPIFSRAYLFVIIPFLFIWVGALLGKLNQKIFLLITILLLFSLIYPQLNLFQTKNEPTSVERTNATVVALLENAQQRNLQTTNLDLLAISDYDPYGWETSYYWYTLEKMTDQHLANIDLETSKAVRLSTAPLETLYVICHNINNDFKLSDCLNSFEEKIQGKHFWKKFNLEEIIDLPQNPILVMTPE